MITLPLLMAVVMAGLIGGVHCVGMCGAISSLLSRPPYAARSVIPIRRQAIAENTGNHHSFPLKRALYLHAGRICTYMLIGAFFGWGGHFVLKALPPQWMMAWYILGNILLILLGLRLLGFQVSRLLPLTMSSFFAAVLQRISFRFHRLQVHPYLLGMTWGALPCGLTSSVVPFAMLSGAAWSGAVLFLCFGLAALPHLLMTQLMIQSPYAPYSFSKQRGFKYLGILFAIALCILGSLGLFWYDMKSMPSFLCVIP